MDDIGKHDKQNVMDLPDNWIEYGRDATETDFQFKTDPRRLEAFNVWFAEQVRKGIFIVDPGTPPGKPWVSKYVQSAWKRRSISTYLAARVSRGEISKSQEESLRSAFAGPVSMDKVRLLATRIFEDLKGFTAQMSTQLSRILAQGMIDGTGAIPLARKMSREIDGLTRERALTIARTETIRAHAEGQLLAFKQLNVRRIVVMAEWSTAGDGRVCSYCVKHKGKIYLPENASGLIPAHPNCRCTWLPYVSAPTRK